MFCTTDSGKYVGAGDLSRHNATVKEDAEYRGACAKDRTGTVHYMGVYEQEKTYARFKTWGAKKYVTAYDPEGPLTTTIAGVSKKTGGAELERKGGLDAFTIGFTFEESAGKRIVYNDFPVLPPITGPNGERVEITRNLCICDNTYKVGITLEYARLLGLKMEGDI